MNEVFDAVSLNPVEWFASSSALAAVVASAVALLRKHVLIGLDGRPVVVLSFALSIGLAYGGKALGFLAEDPLLFGLTAALLASGGKDFVASLSSRPKTGGSARGEATPVAVSATSGKEGSSEVTDETPSSRNTSRARLR